MILEEKKQNFLEFEREKLVINENAIDPLYKFKAESKIYLYILTHV